MKKFKFVESTILRKLNGKLCTLEVQIVQIHGKIWICLMYDIEKIQ